MQNGRHMDVNRIYDLSVVHLFKCFLTYAPALFMLQAPHHLNPALLPLWPTVANLTGGLCGPWLPQIFGWPLFWSPNFFLISRLSSFG